MVSRFWAEWRPSPVLPKQKNTRCAGFRMLKGRKLAWVNPPSLQIPATGENWARQTPSDRDWSTLWVLRTNERRGGQLADDGCSRAGNPGSVKVRETAWAWVRWTGWSAQGSAGKALVER